tara:strand:+ start:195 stop:362 length:168 start_codon:yes stop_codon:yes gene_type:complete
MWGENTRLLVAGLAEIALQSETGCRAAFDTKAGFIAIGGVVAREGKRPLDRCFVR